ncbi:MAG: flagellar assembly protein FliH [Hydrogenophilales bacterium 16-64-46]|nr:MAG: flagellar assembly protein FliH [Hydrogenophilales bacterium 12-64-13]OYZ04105.1 MAG: flagellar assembly protein FliH [Hydrogenophilales bacterium 16-64-46]OZA36854.1 MAG: flagellar assembly protein FliH [Hydrogenophilales bacterium 17-64-34]HQT00034.1 FliH/SctL family protein [Thiobacillus sp.]
MSNAASTVIRSEDPADYPAWEPASFDTTPRDVKMKRSEVALPTLEQIAAIEAQAEQEGYAAGHGEGRAAGLAEGRQLAAEEAARLAALATGFDAQTRQADELISQQVLDLALDLARALLKSALAVKPELVIPLVREAVRTLPAVQQPALLYLNPADVVLVRERIGGELDKTGWQLAEDDSLEAGGCRVETPSNQIDATLGTRWQRLVAALGQQTDWLA